MGNLFLFGIFLGLGLFFILADVLRLPLLSTERAMLSVVRKEKKSAKSFETYLLGFAVKLSKFIKMDEFKRIRMKNVLDAAGLAMTPEVYQAYAFVKSGAILESYKKHAGESFAAESRRSVSRPGLPPP